MTSHLGFTRQRSSLIDRTLIPKYYDPELQQLVEQAGDTVGLPTLSELLEPGAAGSKLGDWLRREHYGSGPVPYVRTSDIVDWRIRPDFKKGVSIDVFYNFASKQDVRANDILFVAHGTYLIGNVAIVLETDLPIVLQDHVFRLRVSQASQINPYYLLAALSTKFVRRQVRARQFSADIIDKIGYRHLDICVPIVRNRQRQAQLALRTNNILREDVQARHQFEDFIGGSLSLTRERASSHHGFALSFKSIRNNILMPKYYDPDVYEAIKSSEVSTRCKWIQLKEFVGRYGLEVSTGVEVGKIANGTGIVPFIRTSDIVNLELRYDIKQSVSEEYFDRAPDKAKLFAGDVVLNRDGTYLVGNSALVFDIEKALLCAGMIRFRAPLRGRLNGFSLLAALNLPAVRLQLRSKQFTRDVIDTFGRRFLEIYLPHPESAWFLKAENFVQSIFEGKKHRRNEMRAIISEIEPVDHSPVFGRPGSSMR